MRVDERESVVVSSGAGANRNLGLHPWRSRVPAAQLIVRAAVPADELRKLPRLQHPTEHIEKLHKVAFPGTVGADQHVGAGSGQELHVSQGAETPDVDAINAGTVCHRSMCIFRSAFPLVMFGRRWAPRARKP